MNAQQNDGASGQSDNKQNSLSWSSAQKPTAPVVAPKVATPTARPVALPNIPTNSTTAKIAGWLAAGVVAGVVVAWVGTALLKHTDTSALNSGTQTASTTQETLFSVPSPQKAGMTVEVNGTEISVPTWIVVYESINGKPGNVLGAALFSVGLKGGTVDLLRATRAGQTYFVTRHSDNGDRRFSLKDDAIINEDGQPSWVSFTAN